MPQNDQKQSKKPTTADRTLVKWAALLRITTAHHTHTTTIGEAEAYAAPLSQIESEAHKALHVAIDAAMAEFRAVLEDGETP